MSRKPNTIPIEEAAYQLGITPQVMRQLIKRANVPLQEDGTVHSREVENLLRRMEDHLKDFPYDS